jgi:hypothetical protein
MKKFPPLSAMTLGLAGLLHFLATVPAASALELNCSIVPKNGSPPVYMALDEGALTSLRLNHEPGKAPVLDSNHSAHTEGTVSIDPRTGIYEYRFVMMDEGEKVSHFNEQHPGVDIEPLFDSSRFDFRSVFTIHYDPRAPKVSKMLYRGDTRGTTEVTGVPFHSSWRLGRSGEADLTDCE